METAQVVLMNDCCRQLDQDRSALLFLLDLTAAFDMADCDQLAHCLPMWIFMELPYSDISYSSIDKDRGWHWEKSCHRDTFWNPLPVAHQHQYGPPHPTALKFWAICG